MRISRFSRPTATVGALLLLALAGCTTTGPTAPGTSSGAPPSASATATAGDGDGMLLVAVYYATDTGTDLRLVRELRRLPDDGGPALTAARAVLAGAPLDPDYTGLWAPDGAVLAVDVRDGVVEVDLDQAATRTTTGSAGAELAVQALVHAVNDALGTSDPVRLLVEGAPVDELFGVLDTRRPIARGDPLSTRLLVQIDAPNEGDVLSSPVTVTGEAAVFEATLPWEVRTPDGTVVQSGVTMTAEGQTFAPFSFTVPLDPGDYVVVISEDDPSDGAGRPPQTDSRAFTVR